MRGSVMISDYMLYLNYDIRSHINADCIMFCGDIKVHDGTHFVDSIFLNVFTVGTHMC